MIMKFKYKIIGGMALLVTAFGSCKKELLDPVPQTSISDATAFSTPEKVLGQVHGMYAAVKNGQFYGGRYVVYNDIRGEEFLNITNNQTTASNTWSHAVASTTAEAQNLWSAAYNAINRCNTVLEGIQANANVVPAATADQYMAEARFLRALSYFSLVTLYGQKPYTADNGASKGLPLRVQAEKGGTNANLARSTVAQTYALILDDLNFAESKLPLSYTIGTTPDINVARAHRNAAIALKTRVYLSMGEYDDVIIEANKIVPLTPPFQAPTGIAHRLNPDFTTTFRNYTTAESIFSLPMTTSSAPGTQNGLAGYFTLEYALNPAGILGSSAWGANDRRRFFIVPGTNTFYNKFDADAANYVPVIRYAEVMLNLAEARARTNAGVVDAQALALLNAVRQRSDASVTLAPLTQQELIDAILTERRIEFLTEGLRSIDLLRLNATIPGKGTISAIPPTDPRYVWPIAENELLYNKLATQN